MLRFSHRFVFVTALIVVVVSGPSAANAHFLWIKTITHDDKSQAFLFFGESADDEAYHLPEPLANAKIWRRSIDGKRSELATNKLDTDDRIGLIAELKCGESFALEATETYGVYGKSLLTYYAKHIHADGAKDIDATGRSKELKFDIVPEVVDDKLRLTVYWVGKPLEGAKVSLTIGGEEQKEKNTDKYGRVEVTRKRDECVSALANTLDEKAKGEFQGTPYEGVMHFASLTLGKAADAASNNEAADKQSNEKPEPRASLLPLPEPVSSFGAAVSDGWLYVYSGHTGDEHQHSAENLSTHFRRTKLEGGSEWEELPMQTPLQGLALVTHGGKIYRIGGLNARNATTADDEDLHSTAEFAEFGPDSRQWNALAPLPAPRSSHNAVIIGDCAYVVGGWHLHGTSPGDWQADALVYDFTRPDAGWQTLPPPPFQRRALAVGEWRGKLVAIGGMNEKGHVSQRVDIFDPQSGQWQQGPDLPGEGMAGFGIAACNLDGQFFVTGLGGIVYRFDETGSVWEEATRMATARFFLQLVPTPSGRLLAVGGATRESHLADIETIDIRGSRSRL